MTTLRVDTLTFIFNSGINAQRYDTWAHTEVYQAANQGRKALDVVALDPGIRPIIVWLIEVKDFRIISNPPNPANLTGLARTVAQKVKDTMEGLGDAALSATNPQEKEHARCALSAEKQHVVLHLEPHAGDRTALFPRGFSADVLQKLRQLVHPYDPNPMVLNIANTPTAGVPWSVS